MTTGIVGGAGRVEPMDAWAATLTWKDGRVYMDPYSIRPNAGTVRDVIARDFADRFDIPMKAAWRRAYRQGWRVIRVQISPAFDHKERV